MSLSNKLIAYTDGSSSKNPGIGGLGYVIVNHDESDILRRYSEKIEDTTNNKAELLAIIRVVEWFVENYDSDKYIVIKTDSKYCFNGFNDWMDKWATEKWIDPNKKEIRKNHTFWKQLHELKHYYCKDRVFIQWVKGHNGNEYNDIAHDLSYTVWKGKKK